MVSAVSRHFSFGKSDSASFHALELGTLSNAETKAARIGKPRLETGLNYRIAKPRGQKFSSDNLTMEQCISWKLVPVRVLPNGAQGEYERTRIKRHARR
jgi:hypothetical protein